MRWLKFSAVGVAGVAVQLGVLWFCARILGISPVASTAMAVEVALLHNFAWHEAWTWQGMPVEGRWRRLVRFHACNGFLSLASNTLFTWMLMKYTAMPLLVSNVSAICATSLLNFALADLWVFRHKEVA